MFYNYLHVGRDTFNQGLWKMYCTFISGDMNFFNNDLLSNTMSANYAVLQNFSLWSNVT